MKKIIIGLFTLLCIFTACANSKTLNNYELDYVKAFTDFAKEHDENFLLYDRKTDEELKVFKKRNEENSTSQYNVVSQVSYDMYDNDGNGSIIIILTEYKEIKKSSVVYNTSCIVGKNEITIYNYDEYEYGDEALKLFEDVCKQIDGEYSEIESYE